MKKIIVVFFILIFGNVVFATDKIQKDNPLVLTASVVFNWLDISRVERDAVISKYQDLLFNDETVYKYSKRDFRNEYKNYLKDKDYKRHYMLVTNNVTETDTENLCGFYRGKILISYGIQYKDDLKTIYYYDGLGNLRYVDKCSDNYPNFPYMSKQYRANGKLVSAIYFLSHDLQYMYNNNKSFKGVWYKDKMYDENAKQILTRTNW